MLLWIVAMLIYLNYVGINVVYNLFGYAGFNYKVPPSVRYLPHFFPNKKLSPLFPSCPPYPLY